MTLINNSWYIGTKIMKNPKYSLHLNKVRKNLAAPGKLLRGSLAIAMHRRAIDQPCLPYFP